MKIRDFCIKYLTENGMFEDQAEAILDKAIAAKENTGMIGKWDGSIDGYPTSMQGVIIVLIKNQALKWIDENVPMHWARQVFE